MSAIVSRARGIFGGAGFILLLVGLVVLQADWRFGLGALLVAVLFLAPFWLPWAWRHPLVLVTLLVSVWGGLILLALITGHLWVGLSLLLLFVVALAIVVIGGAWLLLRKEGKQLGQ